MTIKRNPIARIVSIAAICACFIAAANMLLRTVPNYEAALWAALAGLFALLYEDATESVWNLLGICNRKYNP